MIQRTFLPRRSNKLQKFSPCARAYTLDMARAAMPAAAWLLHDTVGDRVADVRHSFPARKAHHLTPTVTNHRRATTMRGHVISHATPELTAGTSPAAVGAQ